MELRQGKNALVLVGELKEKTVRRDVTKKGDAYISLKLKIASVIEGNLMENTVELFALNSSKLAKGYETVANEYNNGDRIEVKGSYEANEYVKDGEIKSFPKIKGLYVNRVTDDAVTDKAGFEMESVITGVRPEMGKDGKPTGRLFVNFYTVGYKNTIMEFKDFIIEAHLAGAFQKGFPIGSTGIFKTRINKYAVIEETAPVSTASAFGVDDASIGDVVTSYVNERIVFYGVPASITTKYTPEQIAEMRNLREKAINEMMQAQPTPPSFDTTQEGFGADSSIDDSNIPF